MTVNQINIFKAPLISFKRDKNIGNFLLRSVLKSDDQPGTFKCARERSNTCPFIRNGDKKQDPSDRLKSLIALHTPSKGYQFHDMHFV